MTSIDINHTSPQNLLNLDIFHNNISTITNEDNSYPFLRFSNLRSLNFSSNNIKLTEANFRNSVFIGLEKLEILDISNNTRLDHHVYNSTHTLDTVWLPLVSLKKLMVDGIQNVKFGRGISTLKNLTKLTFAGRCSKARLRVIDNNFFQNFPYIETLDLSSQYAYNNHLHFYNISYCSLEAIQRGAIAKLKYLKYLDISYNRMLGVCGFRNVTYDLPNTSISVFKASCLQCEAGMSLTLYCDDVSPFANTSIEKLYFDGNHISFCQYGLLQYFPQSLKVLSIRGNRWARGRYTYEHIEHVKGLQVVDLSNINEHQISLSNNFYENCDSFVTDIRCDNYRSTHTKMNLTQDAFGFCPSEATDTADTEYLTEAIKLPICEEKPRPRWKSPGCSPSSTIFHCEANIFTLPPNLSVLKMHKARLGRTVDWIFFFGPNILERLDLSNNEFYSMVGPICNITKLRYLDLSNNTCSDFSTYLFGFLPNLDTLLLGHNRIGESDFMYQTNASDLFSNQTKLEFLNLEDNKLAALPKNIFYNLTNLRTLKLNNNKLTDWNFTIKIMLDLKHVDLSYNQILFLSKKGMSYIDEASADELTIDLSNNPFECNCNSFAFIDWILKRRHKFVNLSKYFCSIDDNTYNLTSAHVILMKSCASYMAITVTVTCFLALFLSIAFGVIMHRYRFKIRYWYYIAKREFWRHGYQKLHDDEQYRFEAFVSYADEDRMFVRDKIIPQLEQNDGLKLCIHHRDFIPGCSIDENIINGIHYSRKVIFVITKSFLQSQWCLYEVNATQTEFMSNPSRGTQDFMSIFVFKEDVFECLPAVIANKVTTDTYIEFPRNEEDEPAFWIKLKESVCER